MGWLQMWQRMTSFVWLDSHPCAAILLYPLGTWLDWKIWWMEVLVGTSLRNGPLFIAMLGISFMGRKRIEDPNESPYGLKNMVPLIPLVSSHDPQDSPNGHLKGRSHGLPNFRHTLYPLMKRNHELRSQRRNHSVPLIRLPGPYGMRGSGECCAMLGQRLSTFCTHVKTEISRGSNA